MEIKKIICFLPLACLALSSPAAQFEPLDYGQVMPAGWIKSQMLRDVTGGYISQTAFWDPGNKRYNLFGPAKTRNYKVDPDGKRVAYTGSWGSGEVDGYFYESVVMNAFMTGYKPWLELAGTKIEYMLRYQDESGYIGIYEKDDRLDGMEGDNGELWTQSRAVCALLAYYEFTGERCCLDAAVRAVDYTISRYKASGKPYFLHEHEVMGGMCHGLMYVDALEWLYRITGDKKYADFALWLYEDYCKEKEPGRFGDNQLGALLDRDEMFQGHGVHVVEHFRAPLLAAALTGRDDYRQAVTNIFSKLALSLTPSGAIATDAKHLEQVVGNYGSGDQPYEYCTITELLESYSSAFGKLGDARMGDAAENLVFNAGAGGRLPDGHAICYLSSDNKFDALASENFRFQLTSFTQPSCCNLQASKLMAYYVHNMWMRRGGDELVAFLYGPCSVKCKVGGTEVSLTERTVYPFDGKISISVNPAAPARFSILLRNPAWSADTRIMADGATVTKEGDFYKVTKTWRQDDQIEIRFGQKIDVRRVINNELCVSRGPLLYCLPISERRIATEQRGAYAKYDLMARDSVLCRTYRKDCYITPNANILYDRNPSMFTYRAGEKASNQYPYDEPYGYVTGTFVVGGKETKLDLVPMGSALLRRTTFPDHKFVKYYTR